MLDTIKELCALPGVSGFEDAVRDYIKAKALTLCGSVETDKPGNLLCLKKGSGSELKPPVMLAAHMDEVGLLVRRVTDDGYIKFVCAGGIDRRVLIAQKVLIGANKIPAVVGIKPKHLTDEDERKKIPALRDMYLDTGFLNAKEVNEAVKPGDYVTFDTEQREYGGLFCAKATDDRAGCGIMLELMKHDYPRDVWFVFTVQEEIGTRGAAAAAFKLEAAEAVVVEGTTAADIPSAPEYKRICAPGGGVVLPFADGGAIYDLFPKLRGVAEAHGIKWQTKEYVAGGTDASAIQRSKAGCPVGAVSLAVRYIHSPASAVKLGEAIDAERLLREYLKT